MARPGIKKAASKKAPKKEFTTQELEAAREALIDALSNEELQGEELEKVCVDMINTADALERDGVEFMPVGVYLETEFGDE